jgi:hypothetical protein
VLVPDVDTEPTAVIKRIYEQKDDIRIFGQLKLVLVAPMIQTYLFKYFHGFWIDDSNEGDSLWDSPKVKEFVVLAKKVILFVHLYLKILR